MIISYPALFYKDKKGGYFIYFPDIENSATQGDDISDALFMASDYLGIYMADLLEDGYNLPKTSNLNDLDIIQDYPFKEDNNLEDDYILDDSFKSLVYVNLDEYFDYNELIKKTLTIPKWANNMGVKNNLNFSQVLTNAIKELALK